MHFLLAVNKQFGQVRTVSFPKDSWEGALHMEPSPSLCRSSFVGPALNNPRFPAVSGCPGTRDPQPLSQPVLFLTWRNMSWDPSPRLDLSALSGCPHRRSLALQWGEWNVSLCLPSLRSIQILQRPGGNRTTPSTVRGTGD